jgi:hypothetical protein
MNASIPANDEIPCACCGRFHRVLVPVSGRMVGRKCAEDIKLYRTNPDRSSLVWRGWEKCWDKVHAMMTASK